MYRDDTFGAQIKENLGQTFVPFLYSHSYCRSQENVIPESM